MKNAYCNSAHMYAINLPCKGYCFRETQNKRKKNNTEYKYFSWYPYYTSALGMDTTMNQLKCSSQDYGTDQQCKIQQLKLLVADIGTQSRY